MVIDISNKVLNMEYSRKSDDKDSERDAPVKSELKNRSDLKNNDSIAISGQLQPDEVKVEKMITPVSGQDKNVQMQSDVYHNEANVNVYMSQNVQGTKKGHENIKNSQMNVENKPAVDEANDPVNEVLAKDDISVMDSLTAAYGNKETEVGKVIRMTV